MTLSGEYPRNADVAHAHVAHLTALGSTALSLFPMERLIKISALEGRCFTVLD